MSLNSDWCFQYYAFGKTKKDRICLNRVIWIAWNVKHNLGVCSKYRPCILESWLEGGSRSAHNTHVRVSRLSNGIQIANCFSNIKSEIVAPEESISGLQGGGRGPLRIAGHQNHIFQELQSSKSRYLELSPRKMIKSTGK